MKTVVGDSDVPDLACLFCLKHGLIKACAVTGKGTEGRIVELVDVHVISLEHLQCGFYVRPELVSGLSSCLCGDVVAVPRDVLECNADLLLAVSVFA